MKYLPLLLLLPLGVRAQVNRIDDFNRIGWYVYEGDHRLGPRLTIHTEYQARRTGFITGWQQQLLRAGVGYQLLPRLKLGGGYTYLKTHPYGNHPTADAGTFPEKRFYEDLTLTDSLGRVGLTHRLRLEQRWIGVPGASGPLGNDAVWQRKTASATSWPAKSAARPDPGGPGVVLHGLRRGIPQLRPRNHHQRLQPEPRGRRPGLPVQRGLSHRAAVPQPDCPALRPRPGHPVSGVRVQ